MRLRHRKRPNHLPPNPETPEIAALIARAQELCEGCRTIWRIRHNWTNNKSSIVCTAQSVRIALRVVANRKHAA